MWKSHPPYSRGSAFAFHDETIRVEESGLVKKTVHLRLLLSTMFLDNRLSLQIEEKKVLVCNDQCFCNISKYPRFWRAVIRYKG